MGRALRYIKRNMLVWQLAAVLCGFLALAFYPPAHGTMVLVPAAPGAERGMIADAMTRGAVLVGPGPFPNSFVVKGDRSALAGPMLRRGVLVLAAPMAGCGVFPA